MSSQFPVEVIWGRRDDLLTRRQTRLSSKGLAVGLGGQSLANGVKIYAWGYKGRITCFVGCFNT